MRNIDFANVHLGVLDNSHRLPPKIRLFVLFDNGNYNAFGLRVTAFQKRAKIISAAGLMTSSGTKISTHLSSEAQIAMFSPQITLRLSILHRSEIRPIPCYCWDEGVFGHALFTYAIDPQALSRAHMMGGKLILV
ncbi:hypothetical protein [Candidatus Accumulibacter sp. ACC003]|uniref:hypothetical protein n=1 Tax=Candidatus Accumulibacter sp. ACC003 TaxID=2823334 RepID=UPI0025BD1B30|nr:hypothetical protein [Candidatus Accumulibacter sp. ACC003]